MKDRPVKLIIIIIIASLLLLTIGILFEEYGSRTSEANQSKTLQRATSKALPLKYIYLTFDDGPLDGSENIDSVILSEKLKINVFLVGKNILRSTRLDSFYQMYEHNPFIESYNHSFTHANNRYDSFYQNPQSVLTDIAENEKVLNLKFKVVRLPGRDMWRIGGRKRNDVKIGASSADTLAAHGYKLYGWDLEWQHKNDGEPIQSVDTMYNEIVNRLEKGKTFTKGHLVLLLHDEMFQKRWEESELKQLIDRLRTHPNYVFEHIRFYPDK